MKLPDNYGETVQKDKEENHNGNLQLVHGSKNFLSPVTLNIEPKVGDFYFFPHYLMHAVYPFFDSDEERRSVSFNATVDQSLFNE
mgnify:CR=1 FL=1